MKGTKIGREGGGLGAARYSPGRDVLVLEFEVNVPRYQVYRIGLSALGHPSYRTNTEL